MFEYSCKISRPKRRIICLEVKEARAFYTNRSRLHVSKGFRRFFRSKYRLLLLGLHILGPFIEGNNFKCFERNCIFMRRIFLSLMTVVTFAVANKGAKCQSFLKYWFFLLLKDIFKYFFTSQPL